jgi:hypothetical protein
LAGGVGGATGWALPGPRGDFVLFDFCFKAMLIQSPTEDARQALLPLFSHGWLKRILPAGNAGFHRMFMRRADSQFQL